MLYILTPLFCVGLCLGTVFLTQKTGDKVNASAYATLPTGSSAIANIYSNGEFNKDNLNELAKRGGFKGVDAMVSAAENGVVKTSEDFGVTVVNFGSYTYNNRTYELTWIPVYLSEDESGKAILTLWLASTQAKNTNSAHEVSKYSDTDNIYDTSYIRNTVLNSSSNNAKFKMFTTGELANYIINPNQVSWQKDAAYQKNDPKYTRAATSTAWLNDKVWLPSMYEIFDGTLTANSSLEVVKENGGLWKTGNSSDRDKRSNSLHYFARSGVPGNATYVYIPGDDGSLDYGSADNSWAVRPALHLNLSAANPYIDKPSESDDLTYNGTEQTYTPKNFISDFMELSENKQTDAGDYKCIVTLKSGLIWEDGSNDPFKIDFRINKAKPSVTPDFEEPLPDILYITYNKGVLPKLVNVATNATAGDIDWQLGQTVSAEHSDYYWQFTPADTTNYLTITGRSEETKLILPYKVLEISGLELTLNQVDGADVKIYDAYSLADLKKYITVKVVFEDNSKQQLGDADFDFELTNGKNKLTEGAVTVRAKDKSNNTGTLVLNVLAAEVEEISARYNDGGNHLIYSESLSYENIKENLSVTARWNYSGTKFLDVANGEVTVDGEIKAGDEVEFVVRFGNKSYTFYVEIEKADYDLSGIKFEGNKDVLTYDGQPHGIVISGTLPEGVSVEYSVAGQTYTEFTNAGTYEYTASFKHNNPNYNTITKTLTAALKIDKADYDMKAVKFDDKTQTNDGKSYTIEISGTLPDWLTVTYSVEGQSVLSFSATGTYNFTATFTHNNPNYNEIAAKTATLTISDKPVYFITVTFENSTVIYDGETHSIAIVGDLPDGVSVKYYLGETEFTGVSDAGTYEIIAKFTGSDEYAPIPDKTATLLIKPSKFNVESVVFFKDKMVAYDGEEHTLNISGELPEWIKVNYEVSGESGVKFSAVGTYNFIAKFTHENKNYEEINNLTATLTITTAGIVLNVTFEDKTAIYNGETHKIEINGILPDGVTVAYYVGEEIFTGAIDVGVYEVVAKFVVDLSLYEQPEDLVAKLKIDAATYDITGVTFENAAFIYDGEEHSIAVGGIVLPEWITVTYEGNGVIEVGTHKVTAKFMHTNNNYASIGDITAQITISKSKVALPVYKGTLSYTGGELKPTADDFEYNADVVNFVNDKTVAGTNAGKYKAVFALKDTDNYEWATTVTNKKAVFAVALYDLAVGETEVDWTLAKAKITATTSEGTLPVFASESYKGALSGIVGLKYYKDEGCTEEISSEELGYETTYYVKAELLDGDNFELDTSAAALTVAPVTYTTPAKELTFWEKVVVFLKANWLWIVIAVVALILLITIIALCVRASKKKKTREALEEQRRLEKEERRLEREERMARLSQQQAAPQPQYIPQPMPQMMPQMQMPMAQQGGMAMGGGVSEAQFMQMQAELKAEISALKAEQSAKEIAALRAEVAMRDDISVLRSDGGKVSLGAGMSAETLAEIVSAAVEKVLDKREKPAAQTAQQTESAPASTQVPPDAVMTTVTTTKIDTTKKPVQSTNDRTPVGRPIVRNYVAPMPVDDGRVFDVGGFYKPADPVTDLGLTDDETENK